MTHLSTYYTKVANNIVGTKDATASGKKQCGVKNKKKIFKNNVK